MIVTCHSNQELWDMVREQLRPCTTLLDIGCSNRVHSELLIPSKHYLGIDPSELALEQFEELNDTTSKGIKFTLLNTTWDKYLEFHTMLPSLEKPVTVFLMDVIEHVEKEEAKKLLEETIDLAQQVVIFTPLGFMPQEVENMPYQTHISGWTPDDFMENSWDCYVCPTFHGNFGAFFAIYTAKDTE